jgi:hypothetical protein
MGQIITALQMVYEEKFVTKYNVPPLQAVGWEGKLNEIPFKKIHIFLIVFFYFTGLFGFSILSVLLVPMYFIQVPAMSKVRFF